MADASVGGGGGRAASSGSTATPGDEAATTSSSTAKKGGAGGTRRETINLKVAMLGDPATGKTTLMYKYCTGKFDEDYLVTMGERVQPPRCAATRGCAPGVASTTVADPCARAQASRSWKRP